ncbi:MAG TPA: alpha-L-fucosidase [Thermomicrobiales bacterium]|nr:alpha-L-fucosidase [Thermomicrobiales bacterium]
MTDHQLPSIDQLVYQREHQFALFCHFGINTFNGREWSDGSLPASTFAPTDFNAADWALAARDAGAAHLILTAKHHDGFCLWPTATTGYSVASSPWRGGNGDVVAEVANACRDVGIGFGVYLSPWDRHEPSWANDHAAYDALYLRQLEELLTGYGELFEIWFDGAGSERHPYDWDAIMAIVDRHQPQAMVFNMGRPTVRWVGNEDGLASDPCWYVVDATHRSMFDAGTDELRSGARYLPPECDVAIRRHWFWHDDDLSTLKSLRHLEAIWYRSIGLGANLLLNVPPATTGRLDPDDRARLIEFGTTMRNRFAYPVEAQLTQVGRVVTATFPQEVTIDHLVLQEAIENGQRIRSHTIRDPNSGTGIVDGIFTVGSQRVHAFPVATVISLEIELDPDDGRLASVAGFRTGVERIPDLEAQPEFDSGKVH